MVSLLSVFAGVSWGIQLLCKSTRKIYQWNVFSWLGWHVCFEVNDANAEIVTLGATEEVFSWMGKHASLRVSCPGAGVLALCANERFGFLTIGVARETKCHTFVCRNNHTVDNWKGFLLNRKAWVRFTACAHAGCGRIWFLRLTVDVQEKLHVMHTKVFLDCFFLDSRVTSSDQKLVQYDSLAWVA